MADQLYTKKPEATHINKCKSHGCTKKFKTGADFKTCRDCRDKMNTEMVTSLEKIRLNKA